MLRKILLSLFLASLTAALAGCGGSSGNTIGDPQTIDGDNSSTTDSDGDDAATSDVTYFPLHVYMQGDGYVDDDVFEGVWFEPLVHGYMIAPVDASTLAAVSSPSVDEYLVTVDGDDVDTVERGLMMQKVLGLEVTLDTAIIIDISGSTQSLDKAAFLQEVKDFITAAQASSDDTIAGQRFTLWTYGNGTVTPLVSTLTSDAATLTTALDSIADWESSGDSPLYEAILKAIGTYIGNGESDLTDEMDLGADGNDDLIDGYVYNQNYGSGRTRLDGINLSTVLVFAMGPNTNNDIQLADAEAAIQWQSFIVYDEDAETEDTSADDTTTDSDAAQDGTTLLPRPMIYVSLGDNNVNSDISGMASTVIDTASATDFSGVAEQVIAAQQNAMEIRSRPENQYLIRYLVTERDGDHTLILASDTDTYNYTLTTDLELENWSEAAAQPAVEITGPDNAYLAGSGVSLSDTTTLYPATRWTTVDYDSANYSWTVGGAARTANTDGSITLTSADVGATVILINTSLSGGTNSASLTVTE